MPTVKGTLQNISKSVYKDGNTKHTLQVSEILRGRFIVHEIGLDPDKGNLKKYEGMVGKPVEVEAVYGVYKDKNDNARLSVNEA